MLTMGQAAKEAGISKSTLSRAIKTGRVSAARNDKGGYEIDPAELFRVFPCNTATGSSNSSMKRDATPIATPLATDETPVLKAEIEGLKAQLELMRDQVSDLKDDRDAWKDQAATSTRLLEDLRPQNFRPRRRWFDFLKTG